MFDSAKPIDRQKCLSPLKKISRSGVAVVAFGAEATQYLAEDIFAVGLNRRLKADLGNRAC